MSLTTPTKQETLALFHTLQTSFPTSTLGPEKWYILTLASLTAGGHPELASDLYTHLIATLPGPKEIQHLIRRLREALLKLVSVVGIPKPLEAIFSIAEVEREEDRDYSFSREHWSSGPENLSRGSAWLAQIYRSNHAATESTLAAHKDFEWLSREITYGLYLSDHTILGPVETELVVLSGILLQNLKRETGWHLRGMRRIGISYEDVEIIQRQIEKVGKFCGLTLNRIPRVKDIEHEVPWEEEEGKGKES